MKHAAPKPSQSLRGLARRLVRLVWHQRPVHGDKPLTVAPGRLASEARDAWLASNPHYARTFTHPLLRDDDDTFLRLRKPRIPPYLRVTILPYSPDWSASLA